MKSKQPKYYRARIALIRESIPMFKDKERKLYAAGFIPQAHRKSFDKQVSLLSQKQSNEPLSFEELTSFSTWFALHPEKIAGQEQATTSRSFPIKTKGTKADIEQMFAKVFSAKSKPEKEAEALAIALQLDLELMSLNGLEDTPQEYITTYRKTDKNGRTYYYQMVELGIQGDSNYQVLWKGRVSQKEWDWNQEVATEQTDRCISHSKYIICIKN